jgi:hypothetical protein
MRWVMLFVVLVLFIGGCGFDVSEVPEVPDMTLEEMQACETAADCIYADTTCCSFTDYDNIVAINANYLDVYKQLGPDCAEETACILMYANYALAPDCVANICTIVDDPDYYSEKEQLEKLMDHIAVIPEESEELN